LIYIDDQFYADSYGSGLLLRGVLLRFLKRYDQSHQAFDEIINMLVINLSKKKEFAFLFKVETIR
jgi:hypothetical protein